jgi:hypothetical protein
MISTNFFPNDPVSPVASEEVLNEETANALN